MGISVTGAPGSGVQDLVSKLGQKYTAATLIKEGEMVRMV